MVYANSDNNGPIMAKELYNRLFCTSCVTSFSVYFAYILELYLLSSLCFAVLLTSVNYWRYPTVGFRRTIDMITVAISLSVGMYHSFFCETHCRVGYMIVLTLGLTCYYNARTCGQRKEFGSDVLWHMGLHLLGNLSNIVLFYGLYVQRLNDDEMGIVGEEQESSIFSFINLISLAIFSFEIPFLDALIEFKFVY